jgi:predicted acyl esterase
MTDHRVYRLRIQPTQEWHDIYQQHNVDELQQFFDKYLKNEDNGWDNIPRMRLSLLGYNRPSVVNRPISAYPPENFKWKTMFLDGRTKKLQARPQFNEEVLSYDANAVWSYPPEQFVGFTHTFDKYTELCGFAKAELFMSTPDYNDMDVHVVIRKLDALGNLIQHFNIPFMDLPPGTTEADIPNENIWRYVGPSGRLRASHRAVEDESGHPKDKLALLSKAYVWHPHNKEEKLEPNQIVKLEISLWAGGMIFEQGESMRLDVLGHEPRIPEFEGLDKLLKNFNVGKHTVYTGGKYPSSLYVALSE